MPRNYNGNGSGRDSYIIVHSGGFRPAKHLPERHWPAFDHTAHPEINKKKYVKNSMIARAHKSTHAAPKEFEAFSHEERNALRSAGVWCNPSTNRDTKKRALARSKSRLVLDLSRRLHKNEKRSRSPARQPTMGPRSRSVSSLSLSVLTDEKSRSNTERSYAVGRKSTIPLLSESLDSFIAEHHLRQTSGMLPCRSPERYHNRTPEHRSNPVDKMSAFTFD